MKYSIIKWSICKNPIIDVSAGEALSIEELTTSIQKFSSSNVFYNTTVGMLVAETDNAIGVARTKTVDDRFEGIVSIAKSNIISVDYLTDSTELASIREAFDKVDETVKSMKEPFVEMGKIFDNRMESNNMSSEPDDKITDSIPSKPVTNQTEESTDLVSMLSKKYGVDVAQLVKEYPVLSLRQLRKLHHVSTWQDFSNLLDELNEAGLIIRRTKSKRPSSEQTIDEDKFINDYTLYGTKQLQKMYGSRVPEYIEQLVNEGKIKRHPKPSESGNWKMFPEYLTNEQIRDIVNHSFDIVSKYSRWYCCWWIDVPLSHCFYNEDIGILHHDAYDVYMYIKTTYNRNDQEVSSLINSLYNSGYYDKDSDTYKNLMNLQTESNSDTSIDVQTENIVESEVQDLKTVSTFNKHMVPRYTKD